MEVDQISLLLKSGIEDANVQVEKNGGHFHITIVSKQFSGLRAVTRQQLVYKILGEYIENGSIHAVIIKAHTPDEWAAPN